MSKIERHNAYTRLNKKGDAELVIKKKGKQDEETLNELADDILDLLEDIEYAGPLPTGGGAGSPEQLDYQRNRNQPDAPLMVGARGDGERMAGESPNNMTASTPQMADGPEQSRARSKYKATARGTPPRNKYITGYYGDNIDYGATHSESFTGTGAIAIGPGPYQVMDDDDEEDDGNEEIKSENTMSRKNVINEWDPAFQAAGYEPGDYQMPSPTGDGVAKRKAKQSTVGKYDTATSNAGKEWPRDHKETAAMCDVDDDGVEGKPQGGHESSHGDPKDGHQSELGHNWPDQPKLSGSGVAEPVEGNRWSDGGTLTGGSGQDEMTNSGRAASLPKDGPIKGTSGPQLGQPQESWSPNLIGRLLGEEYNLQSLFDAYARDCQLVCLEDFQALCHAHGISAMLDEASILKMMQDNNEFIFYEGVDANGVYWTPTPIAEEATKQCKKCKKAPCKCEGDCEVSEGRKRPFDQMINELQIRDPGAEAVAGNLNDREEDYEFGEFADRVDLDDDMGVGSMDAEEEMDADVMGPGPYGMHNAPYDACPECGAIGHDNFCPECGARMSEAGGIGEEDLPDTREPGAFSQEAVDDEDEWEVRGGPDTHEQAMEDPGWEAFGESLTRFMTSARSIIGKNRDQRAIGEALTKSWQHYVGGFDPRQAPNKVQTSLKEMMKRFPTFNPLIECEAMEKLGGTAIGTNGGGPKDKFLEDQPSEMKELGEPLGKKQTNNLDGTPVIKGTEKGLTGNSKSVKENVEKIAHYVRKQLQESAPTTRGKYHVSFTCLVQENDGKVNRTDQRLHLAEAVADLEELLQMHGNDNVVLEAYFSDGNRVVLKHKIPMIPVQQHGPLVSESSALFRFNRHAEQYAQKLVSEGYTCRLQPHNWGAAVEVLSEKKKWMQDVKSTGECTPMTKSTCTGRKKAFAKRVQKGGDLYSGKKD